VFLCILPEKAVPEMTVSGGMLNLAHSFTHFSELMLSFGIINLWIFALKVESCLISRQIMDVFYLPKF